MTPKICSKCNKEKDLNDFPVRGKDRHTQCRECLRGYLANYYQTRRLDPTAPEHPINRRFTHVYRFYGLDRDQYLSLKDKQNGLCPICLVSLDEGEVDVDHDHDCCPGAKSCGQCVRGLLHKSCNKGLGFLRDDKERILRAYQYLKDYENGK